MKKMICLIAVALMVASVALAAPKMIITAKDLPALKGTWEGILGFGQFEGGTSPAKLEILNDTVPVKVKEVRLWYSLAVHISSVNLITPADL